MSDEYEYTAQKKFSIARVLFAVAGVCAFLWTAMPVSSYNLGGFLGVLALAFLIRLVSVRVFRRQRDLPVWSGWIFVIAMVLGFLTFSGRREQAVQAASDHAERQGVVVDAAYARPVDRCLGDALAAWDASPTARPQTMTKGTYRIFFQRVCAMAEQDGVLQDDGVIPNRAAPAIARAVVAGMRADGLLPAAR